MALIFPLKAIVLLFILFISFLPFFALASVVGSADDALCNVTLEQVTLDDYRITSIDKILPRGVLFDCKDEFLRLTGKNLFDRVTVTEYDLREIPETKYFKVPFSSVSYRTPDGGMVGIHYHFESVQALEQKTTVNKPIAYNSAEIAEILVEETAIVTPPVIVDSEISKEVNATTTFIPKVADGQPPTSFKDSILYGWWFKLTSWFRW